MDWAEEVRVIDRAVNQMRAAGVGVTPARVERVVAAVNAAEKADVLQGRRVVSVGLTPRRPDGSGGQVVKTIGTGAPVQAAFAAAVPYFKLSDARRAELEGDAAALTAKIEQPGLDPVVRDKLKQDLRKIQDELAMDRNAPPDRSSSMPGRGYDRPTGT